MFGILVAGCGACPVAAGAPRAVGAELGSWPRSLVVPSFGTLLSELGRVVRRAQRRRCVAALLALGASAAGCRSALPVPPTGPHEGDEPIIVPYPPPPGRVQVIHRPEKEGMVWIDGEWHWKGRRWIWVDGRWEIPPAGGYYARPRIVGLADGRIAWFPGDWHVPRKPGAKEPGESGEPAKPGGSATKPGEAAGKPSDGEARPGEGAAKPGNGGGTPPQGAP